MPKPKQAAKPKKKGGSSKTLEPESEIDFLEAADEQEKGGGKWKAGDAVKATRFFMRAIDAYNAGLQRYPNSFDLAYNKAHLQYELCQDPRIAPQLGPRLDVLRETLNAHRYALRLNEENADILFNTAQVLTSISEEIEGSGDASQKSDAVQLLREAMELFNACLSRQEMQYYEREAELADAQDQLAHAPVMGESEPNQESMDAASTSSEPAGQWATVEEPITGSTLLETSLAQLSCLSSLVSLSVPAESRTLASLTEMGTSLVRTKIPSYLSLIPTKSSEAPEAPTVAVLSISSNASASFKSSKKNGKPRNPRIEGQREAALDVASFQTSVAEAEYRSNVSSIEEYSTRVREAFDAISKAPFSGESPAYADNGLFQINVAAACADALDDFAAAVIQKEGSNALPIVATTVDLSVSVIDPVVPEDPIASTWTADDEEGLPFFKRARVLGLRGDIELRRSYGSFLSQSESSSDISKVQKYYAAALMSAKRAKELKEVDEDGADAEELIQENSIKGLFIEALLSGTSAAHFSKARGAISHDIVQEVMDDLVQRYLITQEMADAVLNSS